MSPSMTVSLVQVGYGDEEPVADRVDRVASLVAGLPDTELVVLPELWAHGGFASESWPERAETLDGPLVRRLSALAAERGCWLHGGSIIERAVVGSDPGPEGRGMWNTSLLFAPDGELRATYRKIHRFGFGDGEPRLLEAGEELAVLDLEGVTAVRTGLATCYDLRFPELFRLLGEAGVELTVIPAAWPLPRVEHWQVLGRARALENQCWVLQCNTAGTHSGVTMGGHSQVVAPTGEVIGQLGVEEAVLTVEMDLGLVQRTREAFPVLRDRRLRTPVGAG